MDQLLKLLQMMKTVWVHQVKERVETMDEKSRTDPSVAWSR